MATSITDGERSHRKRRTIAVLVPIAILATLLSIGVQALAPPFRFMRGYPVERRFKGTSAEPALDVQCFWVPAESGRMISAARQELKFPVWTEGSELGTASTYFARVRRGALDSGASDTVQIYPGRVTVGRDGASEESAGSSGWSTIVYRREVRPVLLYFARWLRRWF